jgi:hypothetical protein
VPRESARAWPHESEATSRWAQRTRTHGFIGTPYSLECAGSLNARQICPAPASSRKRLRRYPGSIGMSSMSCRDAGALPVQGFIHIAPVRIVLPVLDAVP